MRDFSDRYRETIGVTLIIVSVSTWIAWIMLRIWVLETGATTTWQWVLVIPCYVGAALSEGGIGTGRDLNNSRQP